MTHTERYLNRIEQLEKERNALMTIAIDLLWSDEINRPKVDNPHWCDGFSDCPGPHDDDEKTKRKVIRRELKRLMEKDK